MPDPVSLPATSAATHDLAGTTDFPQIPGYRFLRRIGQGGMATVYLATQEWLDRQVSIKVMDRDALLDETSKQRFENEARTIAKLTHPAIVSIYEVGRTSDGRLYYSMPYLANGDLSQRKLVGETQIVELLRALLSALDYAHARGVVHRDVKQENVLFDSENRPMLTDFGIALSKTDSVRITTAGFAVGSSAYMAPEQARGTVVDRRADLYSVGVLAFELLTGKLPFHSQDPLAMALMHAQDAVPRLPAAKAHWQGFIDRAMAKSPGQRFENAQQMLETLDRIGRRSGDQLSGRVLRSFDRAVAGKEWKRPRVLVLGSVLVLATGLYAARDRLPYIGTPDAPVKPAALTASATTNVPPPADIARSDIASVPAPEVEPPASESTAAPAAAPSNAKQAPAPAKQPAAHAKSKHAKPAHRQQRKTGLIKRLWQRIRRR